MHGLWSLWCEAAELTGLKTLWTLWVLSLSSYNKASTSGCSHGPGHDDRRPLGLSWWSIPVTAELLLLWKEYPSWTKVDSISWDRWLVRRFRRVWEPETCDCNNPVTRYPLLLRWHVSLRASSRVEENLKACCRCVTPEDSKEMSRHRRWKLSECLERLSGWFLETVEKVLNMNHWDL